MAAVAVYVTMICGLGDFPEWGMALDQQLFRHQFEVFKERIQRKGKAPFVSFHEGLAYEWEGYKEPTRQRAPAALDAGIMAEEPHRQRQHP